MTWPAGAVKRRTLRTHTMQSRLCDGILLRMECANTAAIFDKTANIRAVRLTRRRAVIARAQNPPVAHNQRANMPSKASGTRRDLTGDTEKVLIPAWTLAVGFRQLTPKSGNRRRML